MNIKTPTIAFLIISLIQNSFGINNNYTRRKVIYSPPELHTKSYRLKYPKDVISVDQDESYIYMASSKEIRLIALDDIEDTAANQEDNGLVPFSKISLEHELNGLEIIDMAVQSTVDFHIIHVSIPSEEENTFELKSFAIKKKKNLLKNASVEDTQNAVTGTIPNTMGVFAIKGGLSNVIGNGEITIARGVNSTNGALITLDSKNQFLHSYSLTDPVNPLYIESFPLDFYGYKGIDVSKLKLNNDSTVGSLFKLESADGKYSQNLSVYTLKSKSLIQRTNALINLENEITGNTWIKYFLLLGMSSNIIDYLDDFYGNDNITLSEMEQNPIFQKLAKGISDDEVYDYLKRTQLLTQEEINQYRLNQNLNTASGTKWFFTVTMIVGLLKITHIKTKVVSYAQAISQCRRAIAKFTLKVVKPSSRGGKILKKAGDAFNKKADKIELKTRSKLISNFYNQEYPIHAIVTLRKKIYRAKLITKAENKEISKLGYGEQYDRLVKIYHIEQKSPKITKGIRKSIKMSGVFVNKLKVDKRLRYLKSNVLVLLKKFDPKYKKIDLKSDESISYILVEDKGIILAKAKKAVNAIKAIRSLTGTHHLKLYENIEKVLKEQDDLAKIIQGYGTTGHVSKVFDVWATVGQKYSSLFIPKKWYEADNAVSRFLNEHTRRDAIKMGKNDVHIYKINGHDAKKAWYGGLTDTSGEVISQTVARANLEDLSEHSFGSGDNYLEFLSYNKNDYGVDFNPLVEIVTQSVDSIAGEGFSSKISKSTEDFILNITGKEFQIQNRDYNLELFKTNKGELGVHFDLLIHAGENLAGWFLGMPIAFTEARIGHSSTGSISFSQKTFNYFKKKMNPINYLFEQTTIDGIVIYATSWLYKRDYLRDHRDDFVQKNYEDYIKGLNDRLLSPGSFGERKILATVLNIPYVNPQYYIHGEFDKIARSLFNSSVPGTLVSSLILPLTSGFYVNKAYGEYFGYSNPVMLKLLKRFKAEGILSKIDENGMTDLNFWSEYEKSFFLNIILTLEMAKQQKIIPYPKDAPVEIQNIWLDRIKTNLFGEDFKNKDLSTLTPKIQLGNIDTSAPFRYEEEAKDIMAQMDFIKSQTTILPFTKNPLVDESFMILGTEEQAIKRDGLSTLNEVAIIQARLADALLLMKKNHQSISEQEKDKVYVIIYETLFLLDTFMFKNKLVGESFKVIESMLLGITNKFQSPVNSKTNKRMILRTSRSLQKVPDKIIKSNAILFLSIPFYMLIDSQIDAHIKIEEHITNLISKLQNILFSISSSVVRKSLGQQMASYDQIKDLNEYLEILDKKETMLEDIINNSQVESNKYLNSRIYRLPQELKGYSPYGVGMSVLWMATHYLLYKNSRGFTGKLVDTFPIGLLKYSLILWFTMGQVNDVIEKNMYLSTVDFINLYPVYYSTLFEKEILLELKRIKESHSEERVSYKEMEAHILTRLGNHENLNKLKDYKEKIEKLSLSQD